MDYTICFPCRPPFIPDFPTIDIAKVGHREKVEHVPNMYYMKKTQKTASQIYVSRFGGEKTCTTCSLASELSVFQLLGEIDFLHLLSHLLKNANLTV